jgi:hypothetical protein
MTSSAPQTLAQVSLKAGHEIKAKAISSEVLREPHATTNPELGTYLMLGLLILSSIGALLLLCYKCDHPASFQSLRRE